MHGVGAGAVFAPGGASGKDSLRCSAGGPGSGSRSARSRGAGGKEAGALGEQAAQPAAVASSAASSASTSSAGVWTPQPWTPPWNPVTTAVPPAAPAAAAPRPPPPPPAPAAPAPASGAPPGLHPCEVLREEMATQIEELRAGHEELKAGHEELKEECDIIKVEQDLAARHGRSNELRQEVEKLKTGFEHLKANQEELKGEHEELKEEYDEIKDLEHATASLKDELLANHAELKVTVRDSITEQGKKLGEELFEFIDQLRADHVKLLRDHGELEAKHEGLKAEHERVAHATEELNLLKAEHVKLKADHDELKGATHATEEFMEAEHKKEIQLLQAKLDDLKGATWATQDGLRGEVNISLVATEKLQANYEKLKADYDNLREVHESLTSQVAVKAAEHEKFNEGIQACCAKYKLDIDACKRREARHYVPPPFRPSTWGSMELYMDKEDAPAATPPASQQCTQHAIGTPAGTSDASAEQHQVDDDYLFPSHEHGHQFPDSEYARNPP